MFFAQKNYIYSAWKRPIQNLYLIVLLNTRCKFLTFFWDSWMKNALFFTIIKTSRESRFLWIIFSTSQLLNFHENSVCVFPVVLELIWQILAFNFLQVNNKQRIGLSHSKKLKLIFSLERNHILLSKWNILKIKI